jgi:hypothetical protein
LTRLVGLPTSPSSDANLAQFLGQGRMTRVRRMIAQSASELLGDPVRLTVEEIDRIYLKLYVPILQCSDGVASSFPVHREKPLASLALTNPMRRQFVAALDRFIAQHKLPLMLFLQRPAEDDVIA